MSRWTRFLKKTSCGSKKNFLQLKSQLSKEYGKALGLPYPVFSDRAKALALKAQRDKWHATQKWLYED